MTDIKSLKPNTSCPLVLFDLNGTLMDDLDRAVRATNTVLLRHHQTLVDRESFRQQFMLPLSSWFASFGILPHLLEHVEEEWGLEMRAPSPLRQGVRTLLRDLRAHGVTTGVLSAVSPSAVGEDLRRHGLTSLFDITLGGVKDKAHALSTLGRHHAPAYYVGDTAYDVVSAKAAGFLSVAIAGGHQCEEKVKASAPTHFISSFSELRSIINV